MSPKFDILLEGSYQYFENGLNFSQENFKFVQLPEDQSYHIYSEILSRAESGEFLKILVRYEMSAHFNPTLVRIEKSIGSKYAQELYKIDTLNQVMNYTFQNSDTHQDFSRNITSKHYITSPAVSTSAIFTLTKKFDATGRTPITLIGSDNNWTYQAPPHDKIIFAEFKARELNDFKLNNTSLSASHLCLYEADASHGKDDDTVVDLILSKHFGIPYQLTHQNKKIFIKNLKKNTV